MQEIARDVAVVPMLIANAYLVGNSSRWVLVDSGIPGNSGRIRQAAEARFGPNSTPRAIILTHGHFDHAGSSGPLADFWGVKVYVHALEVPYLAGRSQYPTLDSTGPGFFSALSRVFPTRTVNLGDRLIPLEMNCPAPGMPDWEIHFTPGHSPGHVSFFRRSDAVLLAGDAVTTMDLDSMIGTLIKRKQICRPPIPATTNWENARRSVQLLATLRPDTIAAGHGSPMHHATAELEALAANFPIPSHGRYVTQPARADETGVTYLPPKPPDAVPKIAAAIGIGLAIGFAAASVSRKRE
jgi:glyoxylase-like metal-dependent hydrolase (beta-lactamase superfamily II)